MDDIEYYAYLHIDGTVHLKRYFNAYDIKETATSSFVKRCTFKFTAKDRSEAMYLAKLKLKIKDDLATVI